MQAEAIGAGVEQHHELLEGGVAGALADAVDRALHLAGAGDHAGERVGDGEAEIVVAVHRDDDVLQAGRELVERGEELRVLIGRGVADGIRDVDRRRPALDGDLEHLRGERRIRAGGIHRAELHVVDEALGLRDGRLGALEHVVARVAHLVLDVDVARGDERVDPRPRGIGECLASAGDVGGLRAGQAADHGALDLTSDRLHGLEVAGARDREAGLDDVDPETGELLRDLELLAGVERDAGDCSPSRRVVSKIRTRSLLDIGGYSVGVPAAARGSRGRVGLVRARGGPLTRPQA